MISLGGIAKQGSEQSDGDQRDFQPEEIFERVGGTRSLGVLTKLSIKKDYSRSALNNRFDPLLSHLISHQPEFELWRW
jgi:hypothetical protein